MAKIETAFSLEINDFVDAIEANELWIKSMEFKLPIIKEDMKLRLDNDSHVEAITLLTRSERAK